MIGMISLYGRISFEEKFEEVGRGPEDDKYYFIDKG